MAVLFISDLHLSETRPAINRVFFEFLRGPAARAGDLWILGDLFDYFGACDYQRNSPLSGWKRLLILRFFASRPSPDLPNLLTHSVLELLNSLSGSRRDGCERQLTACGKALQFGQFLGIASIHFGSHNHHWLALEPGTPAFKLIHDHFEILGWIGTKTCVRDIDQVQQQTRSLDVSQELCAETMACAGSLDQSRNVGNHIAVLVGRFAGGDHAEIWLQSCERIIGDFRSGRGNPRNQCRFSRIGIADQADIGQQLQLKPIMTFLARTSQFVFARSLMRGRREVLVAAPATSPFGDHDSLIGVRKVVNPLPGIGVVQNRSYRNLENYIVTFGSGAIGALAVAAAFCFVLGVEAEMHQRVVTLARFHNDIAAAPAVSSRWTAARDKLLPAEGHAAISAISGLYANLRLVDEHEKKLSAAGIQLAAKPLKSLVPVWISGRPQGAHRVLALSGSRGLAKTSKSPKRGPCSHRMYRKTDNPRLGLRGFGWFHMYKPAHAAAIDKPNDAVNFGEERVVLAAPDVLARLQAGSALTDNDRSAGDQLSSECFYSKALRIGVAAIFRAT